MEFTDQAAQRLAKDLVDHYGDDAAMAAADRADAMARIGNSEAARLWAAVAEVILLLRGKGRRADA